MDRGNSNAPSSMNYDTNASSIVVGQTATMYAAEQYSSCTDAAAMALNYNWSAMSTLAGNMSPERQHQPRHWAAARLDVAGGRRAVWDGPAMDPKYQYSQVIILLTDGLNTQNRWYTSQTSIDNRQKMTCDDINAAGITLYTVQVNTGGDPTSSLLKNCAGSPGKYPDTSKFFLLTTSNQILTTFNQIGSNLSKLRIAK